MQFVVEQLKPNLYQFLERMSLILPDFNTFTAVVHNKQKE